MRTSIFLLIVLMLPFFLGFTDISYGSVVTESNQHITKMTPHVIITNDKDVILSDQGETEIIELPKIPKSSPSIQANNRLRILMIKERIMTPEFANADYGGITEVLFLEETPQSPGFYPIDFNFVEEMKYEKQYIRHLMY